MNDMRAQVTRNAGHLWSNVDQSGLHKNAGKVARTRISEPVDIDYKVDSSKKIVGCQKSKSCLEVVPLQHLLLYTVSTAPS